MYNTDMTINSLLDEFELTLNDVRWYLAHRITFSILELKSNESELVKLIESGELEDKLYNMEERYLEELQDLLDRDKIDEVNIRESFNEMLILKRKRFT